MSAKKECLGTFKVSESECHSCEANIECFEKTFSCASTPDAGVMTKCRGCPVEVNDICQTVNKIKHSLSREKTLPKECPGFGKNSNTDTCLVCYSFPECEVYQLAKENLSIDTSKIRKYLLTEITRLKEDPNECFGQFSFTENCTECDFYIECRKESKILPYPAFCSHFPTQEDVFVLADSNCRKCPSEKTCSEELTKKKIIREKELESRIIFLRPFPLKEIRKIAIAKSLGN